MVAHVLTGFSGGDAVRVPPGRSARNPAALPLYGDGAARHGRDRDPAGRQESPAPVRSPGGRGEPVAGGRSRPAGMSGPDREAFPDAVRGQQLADLAEDGGT